MLGKRLAAASLLAVAAGLSLATLLNQGETTGREGASTSADAAIAKVRAGFRPGDLVRIVPAWNEDLWARLKGIGPGAELFPFAALLRGDRIDTLTLLRGERIWVIGTHGRQAVPPERLFTELEPTERSTLEDGTEVALYTPPTVGWFGSLSRSLKSASVARRDPSGHERECTWKRDRFRCGKEGWENPQVATRDVFHNEVSWVLAHPPPNNETLVIRWTVAGGSVLAVRTGFTLKGVRKEQGSSTSVRIMIDGKEADSFTLEPHEYRLELRLHPLGALESREIRFEIHASDHRLRQLMLEADVLGDAPPMLIEAATYSAL